MPLIPTVNSNDHIQGKMNSPIILVEYGDYQCPYCADFYYTIKKIQEKMGDKLAFVFRNFPLDMHPNALHAAIAAEIMAKHGKFWQMHDILYENQDHLGDNYLLEYAQRLGVSESEFKRDFNNEGSLDAVQEDIDSGLKSGVNGTPFIFINNQRYEGENSYQSLMAFLKGIV